MKITCETVINKPVNEVFEVFTDIKNAEKHLSGIEKIEVLEGSEFAEGFKWRETRTLFGKQATEDMWVTSLNTDASYVVEAESHGNHYTSTYTFSQESTGETKVVLTFEGKPVSLMARLMIPLAVLFNGPTKKALEKDFSELKSVIESA